MKHWLLAICFCFLLVGSARPALAAELALYVNGNPTAVKPVLSQQTAMLPLRDMFALFGCERVDWQVETATVTANSGDFTLTMQVGNPIIWENYGYGEGNTEETLPQVPMLQNGKVYLPLRYFAELFQVRVDYQNSRIDLTTPFLFQNGQWYQRNQQQNRWQPVQVDQKDVRQQDHILYVKRMAHNNNSLSELDAYHLFALDQQGNAKLLLHFPGTAIEYKITDSAIYYETILSAAWSGGEIGKANLTEPICKEKIGRSDFSYGSKPKLVYSETQKCNVVAGFERSQWEVKPEGVYAVGYRRGAIIDGIVQDQQY